MKKLKGLDGTLDILWSELVKLRAGGKCEIPNCTFKPTLNSHHIFTRSNKSTRWDVQNGISLCITHHTFGKESAHRNGVWFTYFLEKYKGKEWLEALNQKAHTTKKWTKAEKEELAEEMRSEIEKLKLEDIKNFKLK